MITISDGLARFSSFAEDVKSTLLNKLNLEAEDATLSSYFSNLIAEGKDPIMLLAKKGKKVIGWMARFPDVGDWGTTSMFYVAPSYRRQKVGTMLAKKALEVDNVHLTISPWSLESKMFRQYLKETIEA
jgi:GNAT superfamily N-acetyltransferase